MIADDKKNINWCVPVYVKIIYSIKLDIASGRLVPGGRVPSVREIATMFDVNPNTAQRALVDMEREGLVYADSTAGRFVTKDTGRIAQLREEMSGIAVRGYVEFIKSMGSTAEEAADMLLRQFKRLEDQA